MKIIILFLLLTITSIAYSTPQFALQTSNRCMNCHTNYAGSGTRNELGWTTSRETSIINWDTLAGFHNFPPYSFSTNSILDGKIIISADSRLQSSKALRAGSERKWQLKQINLSTTIDIIDELSFDCNYNFAENKYQQRGQQAWAAALYYYQPNIDLIVKVGKIQPSIGIRYDDHTSLIKLLATSFVFSSPILAVDYSDYGGELYYDVFNHSNQFIVNLTAGCYSAANFEKVFIPSAKGEVPIVDKDKPSFSSKITLYENKGYTDFTNSYLGFSGYFNDNFKMYNAFGGINLFERISLFGEYAHYDSPELFESNNAILGLNIKLINGLNFEVRAEQALTHYIGAKYNNKVQQLVLSSQFFPFPFLEIKPEYRLIDTSQDPMFLTQYKGGIFYLQFHLFY